MWQIRFFNQYAESQSVEAQAKAQRMMLRRPASSAALVGRDGYAGCRRGARPTLSGAERDVVIGVPWVYDAQVVPFGFAQDRRRSAIQNSRMRLWCWPQEVFESAGTAPVL